MAMKLEGFACIPAPEGAYEAATKGDGVLRTISPQNIRMSGENATDCGVNIRKN
jgi:hypothetical protein